MSLWFRKSSSERESSLFSVSIPLDAVIFVVLFAVALLAIEIVKSPSLGLCVSAVVSAVGAALRVACAVMSHAKRGRSTFWTSRRARLVAHVSYVLIICGALILLLALSQILGHNPPAPPKGAKVHGVETDRVALDTQR
jgi:hypothetical protein